jgi:threonine synthase
VHDPGTASPAAPGGGRWSLARYREALPALAAGPAFDSLTLGEGGTPLVAEPDGALLKLDFLMPTLSFKDRGSVVLLSAAAALGVRRIVADSSGNAGVSIAAYASRAGIESEIFVPAGTAEGKLAQLRAFGAGVQLVPGDRAATAAAAIERVESSGSFYASHVFNPFFLHGTKTVAFEIWEQLGRRAPEALVVPAGNGTLLLGAALGFSELAAAGLIESTPRLLAVQAERCAPLRGNGPVACGPTAAEGIAIAEPPRREQMRAAVEASNGAVLTAGEDEIVSARSELARLGIDVEPTAAVAYAAWRGWAGSGAAGAAAAGAGAAGAGEGGAGEGGAGGGGAGGGGAGEAGAGEGGAGGGGRGAAGRTVVVLTGAGLKSAGGSPH